MIKNKFYILIFLFVLFNSSLYAQSTVGTDFWVTFLPNEDDLESLTLIATGNNSCTGVVTNPLTGWNSSFSISPGSITNINIPITKPSLPVYDVITENENLNNLFTYVDGADYVFRYCRYAWTIVRKSCATAYFFIMWTQCKNCDNAGLDKTFEFVK